MNTKANKTDTKTVWTRTVVISLAAVVVAACGSAPAHRSNGQQPSGLHQGLFIVDTPGLWPAELVADWRASIR